MLEALEITIERVRAEVAEIIGKGEEVAGGQIPFTPRAKKVLELSMREALSLGHNDIGTEALLLGVVRENEGVASRILLGFGADAETVRNRVIEMLTGPGRRDFIAPPMRTGRRFHYVAVFVGWALFAVALGVGILIGWAIWG